MAAAPRKRRKGTTDRKNGRKKGLRASNKKTAKRSASALKKSALKNRAGQIPEQVAGSLSRIATTMDDLLAVAKDLRDCMCRSTTLIVSPEANVADENAFREEPLPAAAEEKRTPVGHHDEKPTGEIAETNAVARQRIVKNTYEQIQTKDIAKRKYKLMGVLLQFAGAAQALTPKAVLRRLNPTLPQEGGSAAHTDSDNVFPESEHLIGRLFRALHDMGCLEPAHRLGEVTENMKNYHHTRPIVRSWVIADLGRDVVKYHIEKMRLGSKLIQDAERPTSGDELPQPVAE